jgi:hypothetical protein
MSTTRQKAALRMSILDQLDRLRGLAAETEVRLRQLESDVASAFPKAKT